MNKVWLFNEHQAATVLQKLVAKGVVKPAEQNAIVRYLKSDEMDEYCMHMQNPDPPKTTQTAKLPVAEPAVDEAETIGSLKGRQ